MLWETIKKVLQKQKGACIIVEDGKPTYVVTSFDEYEKIFEKEPSISQKIAANVSDQELIEKINQEIENWKTAQAVEQAADAMAQEDEVKIENLPIQ